MFSGLQPPEASGALSSPERRNCYRSVVHRDEVRDLNDFPCPNNDLPVTHRLMIEESSMLAKKSGQYFVGELIFIEQAFLTALFKSIQHQLCTEWLGIDTSCLFSWRIETSLLSLYGVRSGIGPKEELRAARRCCLQQGNSISGCFGHGLTIIEGVSSPVIDRKGEMVSSDGTYHRWAIRFDSFDGFLGRAVL